jgi:hypothetical protein
MTETNGFAAYCLYSALRLHFTSNSYNYFKYNGKTNVSKDSFMVRKDKFSFYKLAKQYYVEDLKYFIIANFLVGKTRYVQELIEQDAVDTYTAWLKRTQALSYRFKEDLGELFKHSPAELLKVKDGQLPLVVNLTMRSVVTIETLVILDDLIGLFSAWDGKIDDDIVWPDFRNKCLKYKPFLNYDKEAFKKVFMETVKFCQ